MRQICEINLIAFYALLLFISNNGVTNGYSLNNILLGLKQLRNLRHGILPGTLWCGRGNVARDDSQLGAYRELDACCRTHDRCDDFIKPKATKYGLYNRHICRSSLCACDLLFYDCLMRIQSVYPSTVGKIYFRQCKECLRTFQDSQECIKEGLDISEETDRKGRRVFCAKFDRNPKWGQLHNVTSPRSIYNDELLTLPDDGATQPVS